MLLCIGNNTGNVRKIFKRTKRNSLFSGFCTTFIEKFIAIFIYPEINKCFHFKLGFNLFFFITPLAYAVSFYCVNNNE